MILSHQKQISQQLVKEADLLKQQLKNPAQHRLRELIIELEVILLQIANLETTNDLTGIELIKSGIDRNGILLKINLEEMKESNRKDKTLLEEQKRHQQI